MGKFIIISFVFMGWAFYEMSGGADFDPIETRQARIELPAPVVEETLEPVRVAAAPAATENVTRVSLNLTSVDDVARPEPAVGNAEVIQAVVETSADAISDETPTIVLPSLVGNAISITPVDFDRDETPVTADVDVRAVTGSRVNVRGGPGTDFSVVNSLVRGDEVEILQDPGNGWVQLRPINGGQVGWMADFLLSEG
ncbi:SH3 domain-containing protein [uncultured Tateyamaria sp.]|uniref:SH3 domain-containing protein n=1 Tax=uncultured Tateyamaria sp. TaxID=455651 RepID=UPI0026080264|nr:SH3 domain-containing protein [uncultured Tateyamaria sp.]